MVSTIPGLPASHVGPYRIEGRLGAGGMGVVYLGRDEHSGVASAVKLLRPEYVADPQLRDRLRREVLAAQRVPRFCTAQLLGADLDADQPWLATEYIEAPSLDVVLLEQGRLPGPELDEFAVGVAVALRAIHQHGVVHRDLKPSNVLLSPVGPRVIDFGIARVEGTDTPLPALTPTGVVVGTPRYMAPEQVRGGPVTAAVDVFAWAGLVTYAATGAPPFGGDDDTAQRIRSGQPDLRDLAQPLRRVVAAAFTKDPARRPSAAQLVAELSRRMPTVTSRVLATATADTTGTAAGGTPAPVRVRGGRGTWSRRRVLAAAALVAAAGAAGGGALRWQAGRGGDPLIGEPLVGHTGPVDSVAVGELDGEAIAVSAGTFDQAVRVWHLGTGAQIDELTTPAGSGFRSVAVGQRDGSPVAVVGGTGAPSLQVWDLTSGEQVEVPFTDHTDTVYQASVSSVALGEWEGAPFVVSGGSDRTIRAWDLVTGDQLGEPYRADTAREGLTIELAVATGEWDGAPIVVSSGNLRSPWARVWDLRSGAQVGTLRGGHSGRVGSVAVGERGGATVIVSGSQDHTVRVWRPTGAPAGPELAGHDRYVRSVAFGTVDGVPIAVSGGDDHTVRVWDLARWQQVGPELTGHTGNVTSVAVAELDGTPIAVSCGGHDSTVRRWRLPVS